MKEIPSLSSIHTPLLLGDFLTGRTSIRPPTPIGMDGRWTARCAGWRWRRSGPAGISRQRRAGAEGVAGLWAAWLQFFRRGHAERSGDFPQIRALRRKDGIRLSGWTGRMDGGPSCDV